MIYASLIQGSEIVQAEKITFKYELKESKGNGIALFLLVIWLYKKEIVNSAFKFLWIKCFWEYLSSGNPFLIHTNKKKYF